MGPEMEYPDVHAQKSLLGWGSQVHEYHWASALGTKGEDTNLIRMWSLTLRSLSPNRGDRYENN